MPMMIRDLKVKLTDAELKNLAKQMSYEEQTNTEIREEAKSSAKGFKTRIDASDKIISDLAEKIRTETETRAVEVYEKADERTFTVKMYRADNHEMINTRPMTAQERLAATRPNLPGVPLDPPPADAFAAPPASSDAPKMKEAAGDMVVTGGAGGLPADSPALPAETSPVDDLADELREARAEEDFGEESRSGDLEEQLDQALEEGDSPLLPGDEGPDPDPAEVQREYDEERARRGSSNVLPMKPKRSHKKKTPKV